MGWNEKMNCFKYSFLVAVDFPGSDKVNVWVFDTHDDTLAGVTSISNATKLKIPYIGVYWDSDEHSYVYLTITDNYKLDNSSKKIKIANVNSDE